jgi:hypothetical protein
MDEETAMFRSRKKRGKSLFKRLLYLIVLVSGGSAGVGGWAFKDHPRVQALWTLITGAPADQAATDLDSSLVSEVSQALRPRDEFRKPGTYRVTIARVQLDQRLFKPGHTVDIQARVKKLDRRGHDQTLWDAKAYGERLAVAGKDELTAGWPHRPFAVDWNPGDQLVLEVFDARTSLFTQPRRFTLAQADNSANEFPLRPGDFPLEPVQAADAPIDPRQNHVVLHCQRVGDRHRIDESPTQVAERPIVIK